MHVTSMLLSYFLATRVNSYLYCDLLENEEETTVQQVGVRRSTRLALYSAIQQSKLYFQSRRISCCSPDISVQWFCCCRAVVLLVFRVQWVLGFSLIFSILPDLLLLAGCAAIDDFPIGKCRRRFVISRRWRTLFCTLANKFGGNCSVATYIWFCVKYLICRN